MTDAPETMWREPIIADKMYPDGGSFYHELPTPRAATAYTRGDIHGAALARIAQLEGALGSLQGWAQSKPHHAGETPREYHLHAIICEALTALKAKP
jgi:hypothetical protein